MVKASSTLPPTIIALTFLHDLLVNVNWPKSLSRPFLAVSHPFKNFLVLDDVSDSDDRRVIKTPPWKNGLLLFLPFVEVCSELALFCFYAGSSEENLASIAILNAVAWVSPPQCRFRNFTRTDRLIGTSRAYAALRVWQKPPVTPPYWLLCFYIFVFISAASEVAVATFDLGVQTDAFIALEIFHCAISACLVYVIGTFPVKHIHPCRNVATAYDVSSQLLAEINTSRALTTNEGPL